MRWAFAALLGGPNSAVLRSPITWVMLAYASWGAATKWLNLGPDVLEVLRNSVVWSYSVFALLVAGFVLRARSIERALD